MASSESVKSCDKNKCFYNYKLESKELLGGLWCDLLGFSEHPSLKACYMSSVCKRDGDIQWRVLHGGLAKSKRLVKMNDELFCVYFVMFLESLPKLYVHQLNCFGYPNYYYLSKAVITCPRLLLPVQCCSD